MPIGSLVNLFAVILLLAGKGIVGAGPADSETETGFQDRPLLPVSTDQGIANLLDHTLTHLSLRIGGYQYVLYQRAGTDTLVDVVAFHG